VVELGRRREAHRRTDLHDGGGRERRRLIITHDDGEVIEFDLEVDNRMTESGAPVFQVPFDEAASTPTDQPIARS